MLGLRGTDEIMPNVGRIVCTSDQWRYQFATRKFAFGESCGLESHAETIDGRGNRHKATIESKPARAWCRETVYCEPSIPTNALLLTFDKRKLQQVSSFPDSASKRGRAHGTHDFFSQRQYGHAFLPRRSVAYVDVELIVAKVRVVGSGRQPDFQFGMLRDQFSQPRHQPLRGQARSTMNSQKIRRTRARNLESVSQFIEGAGYSPQQLFAGLIDLHPASVALEQRRSDLLFEVADGMAHGAWRQPELARGRAE